MGGTRLSQRDIVLGVAAFAVALAAGNAVLGAELDFFAAEDVLGALFAVGLLILALGVSLRRSLLRVWRRQQRRSRRAATPVAQTHPQRRSDAHALAQPWVIDGDTLDDRSTLLRYRLENIDAPETEEHAQCAAELHMGKRAKWAAVELVRNARVVTAKPTGKIDPYGRIVARIELDGRDLGETLMARGLARAWTGARESWCGANGPLHQLAMKHYKRPICAACSRAPR